ncbi:MAG: TlpA family protein disulfide reductase [Bacteroidaceae bacterium]|nr:TlpA family protein disulfide reductase [Bacteroidaceae bacterium]
MLFQNFSYRKSLFVTVGLLMCVVQACAERGPIKELWQNKTFNSAGELVQFFDEVKAGIPLCDSVATTENMCNMIWYSGEYIIKCKGKNEDINLLPGKIEKISFDNDVVKSFMQHVKIEKFTDHYFMLQAMKRGCSFDASRDGLTITIFFPIRAINSNDYAKLHDIFSSKNSLLHQVYLEKMKFPINNGGCTKEFYDLLPIIEKNVENCNVKNDILELYKKYIPIMDGKVAPNPTFSDRDGKIYSFQDFLGKILVIDVWATWCSSCLKKMPAFMQLKEDYKTNPLVEFITVSIDRRGKKAHWASTLDKYKMNGMINLITGTVYASDFEVNYNVSGVPRYIVIDSKGNIVSAFAPGPDSGLRELVEKTLKQK